MVLCRPLADAGGNDPAAPGVSVLQVDVRQTRLLVCQLGTSADKAGVFGRGLVGAGATVSI